MKTETWTILGVGIFFALTAPIYWVLSKDPTGTTALTMTFLLCALLGFYLGVVAKQIPDRPEDRSDGEIADGAGEQGFFRLTAGGPCSQRWRSPCVPSELSSVGGCSSSVWASARSWFVAGSSSTTAASTPTDPRWRAASA